MYPPFEMFSLFRVRLSQLIADENVTFRTFYFHFDILIMLCQNMIWFQKVYVSNKVLLFTS